MSIVDPILKAWKDGAVGTETLAATRLGEIMDLDTRSLRLKMLWLPTACVEFRFVKDQTLRVALRSGDADANERSLWLESGDR